MERLVGKPLIKTDDGVPQPTFHDQHIAIPILWPTVLFDVVRAWFVAG